MKEFKKLRGNRVYLNIPEFKESPIYLTEELKQAFIEDEKKKYTSLEVYAVGDLVTDIEEGDKVMVDPQALQNASVINISDEKKVILVSPFDIIHIW
jgi:hypothetical protein